MKDIEYSFSKKSLILTSLILISVSVVFSFLILKTYKDNLTIAAIFSIPILIILPLTLPKYFRFFYCILINKPAIIIRKDKLIDNMNNRDYNWQEIKRIEYRPNKGKAFGGHSAIVLKNANTVIEIPHNAIQCNPTKFLDDLILKIYYILFAIYHWYCFHQKNYYQILVDYYAESHHSID